MKMIDSSNALTTIAACFFLAGTAGAAASGIEDIVNYRQYSATLSSSGQPTEPQLEAVDVPPT